jgi:PII-like signaling protein
VDSAVKIAKLLPQLKEMVTGGLVTIEDVGVVVYSPSDQPK